MAAATSSSNPTLQWKYDVFLSFRGEDTRNNFTSHLYTALLDKAIHTFIDDNELERGEEISPALLKAIEESKISIIILSENYASSSWCLDELLKILECKNTIGQLVVPVFYRVDPSYVRNQIGSFAEAFAKHELKEKLDKVYKWRDALTNVVNLAGHTWQQNRPDSKLLHDIVEDIMMKLYHKSSGDFNNLVGIDSRIEQILSLLCIGLESACIVVGIWGMGGIGKTTIARAIFNHISSQFDGCCFLENVRESSEKYGVVSLRKELGEILKDDNIKRGTVNLESKFISDRHGRKKVLIVLDDVDDSGQLESIIGRFDRFGRGSRIIITTRNKRALTNGVKIYEVKKLNDHEALRVLSLEAFDQNYPIEDFLELSKMVVKYADGIPLALKVLGSFLFGRSKGEWKSALDRLKETPHHKIQEVLRISYDGLNQKEKDIFCDIACFFKGWNKDHVMKILDGCGLFPDIGITVLVEKSLITISNNILFMHDLLQEMGWEIVHEVSKEPGKRSRLWNHEDVYHVLTKETGTKAVEGIFLDLFKISKASLSSTAFKGMCNLRFLKLSNSISDNLHFPDGLESLSNKLSYLHWQGYPLEFFPQNFHPENLVELDLSSSKVKHLWEGTWPLFKLKLIKLDCCMDLIKIPDLSKAPNLECMSLYGCKNVLEVHSSIQYLSKLMVLDLGGCKKLTSLPSTINLRSLRELDLNRCSKLKKLPDSLGYLSSLRELDLNDCKRLQSLPELPPCLTNIWAKNCISLQTMSISSSIRVTGAEHDLPIQMKFRYDNCLKLDQNSRNNIEADAQLKIQLFATTYHKEKNCQRRPAFEFVCPGSDIPEWFSYKSRGFMVTAQLPLHWGNSNFLGFALCIVVALEDGDYGYVECKMKTYNGEYYRLFDKPVYRLESEHMFLWYMSCLELRKVFGDDWYHNYCYNEASFQFHTRYGMVVKKCGVHLLYAQDEDERNFSMIPYRSPNENFGVVDQGLLEPMAEEGCNDHNFCCDEHELNGTEGEAYYMKSKFYKFFCWKICESIPRASGASGDD